MGKAATFNIAQHPSHDIPIIELNGYPVIVIRSDGGDYRAYQVDRQIGTLFAVAIDPSYEEVLRSARKIARRLSPLT